MRDATGLTCSIAVAPNKLLAKIASELDKPDGLTILRAGRHRDAHLAAAAAQDQRHRPEGEREARRARHQDDRRARARRACAWLIEHFGRNYGAWLSRVAHGEDDRDVVTESEPVSISRETTFERDLSARRDRAELSEIFTDLCERLAGDLTRKGYVGRTVGIKLRFDNFKTVTRDRTIERADAGCADDPARGRRMPEARAARAAHPPARRAHRIAVAAHRRRFGRRGSS